MIVENLRKELRDLGIDALVDRDIGHDENGQYTIFQPYITFNNQYDLNLWKLLTEYNIDNVCPRLKDGVV
jgi:hypothetical protein